MKSNNLSYRVIALIFCITSIVGVGFLGVCAYIQTPSIFIDRTLPFTELDTRIIQIEDQPIDKTFLYRFPEFNSQKEESQWWQMHQAVYEVIQFKENIHVLYNEDNGLIKQVTLPVKHLLLRDALKDMGLIYLVAAVFLFSAISSYWKHKTLAGQVLCYFFLSCSLFLVSAAPVACRSITLIPGYFKLLVVFNYIGNGGLLTYIHLSLIFPEPKAFIRNINIPVYAILYGFLTLVTMLYLSKIFAFNTSYPFMIFWVALAIGAFTHSILTEKEVFFKKQIALTLASPMIVAIFFILFHSAPSLLGTTQMHFTYFSLLTLILPFSMSSAMDNLNLYTEKIESERRHYREREQIRQDLHDNTLNNLAKISMLSEMSLNMIQKGDHSVEEKLKSIKAYSSQYSAQIRELLYISDEHHNTWNDLCDNLRKIGHDLVQGHGIEFDIIFNHNGLPQAPPGASFKLCLYHIFKEAVINAIKHADAVSIECTLHLHKDTLSFSIKDNGKGFDVRNCEQKGYGLVNIKNRVKAQEGSLLIDSIINKGTNIKILLPLIKNTAIG